MANTTLRTKQKAACRKDDIEVRVLVKSEYKPETARWADLVISAGGDGTFLAAASRVRNPTPVIGINTDPIGYASGRTT